jgi:hypothetical protein
VLALIDSFHVLLLPVAGAPDSRAEVSVCSSARRR